MLRGNAVLIAVQEDMLPGKNILEKFETASRLGIQGIEFWGRNLTPKVPEIIRAVEQTGIRASSVNHGDQSCFLGADLIERERAMAELRQSITDAAAIGAKGVIFVPHPFGPLLDSLTPFMSGIELELELLHTQIQTLLDLIDQLGIELYVEPINRYETPLLNRLEQAAAVSRRIKHPRVRIVADLFHMVLEERDIVRAIRDHAPDIGHVHLADSNRRLPGQGILDFAKCAAALREIGYEGWAAYECDDPSHNEKHVEQYVRDLPPSLDVLRKAGFMSAH